MGSRRNSRNKPPAYDERIRQESGMMHHAHHPVERLPPSELFEEKWACQEAELEQLRRDNHKLAAGQLAMRQEHAAAIGERDKMREHGQSICSEGDIEVHILLDKIANQEADIRAKENIKRVLQEAHIEARRIKKCKLELSAKVEQATKELECSHENLKRLPEMRATLDSLKEEYWRLRKTFEYERGRNLEKVEQLKILENNLIEIADEVERSRTEVSNAGKIANVPIPYGGPNMDPGNLHPPPFHGNGGGYSNNFGGLYLHTFHGAPMQITNPYARGGFTVGPQVRSGSAGGADGGFAVGSQVMSGPAGSSGSAWGGVYDTSHTQM
ncbi:hypothetical protein ACS0TY_034807 [Phlomoides rotata]